MTTNNKKLSIWKSWKF